jgi:hypothetical protein
LWTLLLSSIHLSSFLFDFQFQSTFTSSGLYLLTL